MRSDEQIPAALPAGDGIPAHDAPGTGAGTAGGPDASQGNDADGGDEGSGCGYTLRLLGLSVPAIVRIQRLTASGLWGEDDLETLRMLTYSALRSLEK